MNEDSKTIIAVILGFILAFVIIATTLCITNEIQKNGDAQRCAQFNYKCGGEE